VKRAVLLMAYGGPATLSEVEPFLLDVRGGRETPEHLVEEVKARYREIGGGSPILELTRDQARALEVALNGGEGAGEWRVFVGMRHWHPYIREVVGEIAAGGFDELVALCLTPQESRMSVGAYFRALEEALEEVRAADGGAPMVVPVRSWHDHPGFLDAVAARVLAAMRRFGADERPGLQVVFTAHSLPESILSEGDPYDAQVRETAGLVAERVEREIGEPLAWHVAYQSAGARAVAWIGPSLDDTLDRLAREGHGQVLVAPVGFVSDHVEILFDLDIEAKARAAGLRMHLERTESLNDSPGFIEALADVVRMAAAQPPGW
jgi:ferrochelatase